MKEIDNIRTQEIALTVGEMAAFSQIRWIHEDPHSDGGKESKFGLKYIRLPRPDGNEYISLSNNGQPRKEFVTDGPTLLKGGGWNDGFSVLMYDNLGIHAPIAAYLIDARGVIDPPNPARINEIGDFIVEVDRTFIQDYESRAVLGVQQNLLTTYQGYIKSGILSEDDKLLKRLVEDASLRLKLIEDSRKILPERVRELPNKARQLGVIYIAEVVCSATAYKYAMTLDPMVITAIYTPEADTSALEGFFNHSREHLRWMKALNLKELAEYILALSN